jgi:hypothetical protein
MHHELNDNLKTIDSYPITGGMVNGNCKSARWITVITGSVSSVSTGLHDCYGPNQHKRLFESTCSGILY